MWGAIATKIVFKSITVKHGTVDRIGTRKLTFFKFPFQEKGIVENINIK